MAADAVAYHAALAPNWERRYRKRSFQVREEILLRCLQERDLAGTLWLDAGCGTGTLSRLLAARGCRVLGVDAATEMVDMATQFARSCEFSAQLTFERVDTVASLALHDNSLDGIVCSSVLEYVPDPAMCLKEFARVLKRDGTLLASVPNRNSLVRRAQLACHRLGSCVGVDWASFLQHSRQQYSAGEFKKSLEHAGFAVEQVLPFGSPLPALARRFQAWASLLMFVARKRA